MPFSYDAIIALSATEKEPAVLFITTWLFAFVLILPCSLSILIIHKGDEARGCGGE